MIMLYDIDIIRISLALVVLLVAFTEIGFRLGFSMQSKFDDRGRSSIIAIQSSVLALLGLLLAFTFSFAATRYDMRKALVVEDSNAIGTAYRRAAMFPGPEGVAIQDILRQYVDTRVLKPNAIFDKKMMEAAIQKSEELQDLFWAQATELGRKDPHSITAGLLIASLNDVIDIHTKRVIALANRIPEIILLLIFVASAIAMGIVGFVCGLSAHRNFVFTSILSILIAFTLFIIQDLDRSREGMITVSQRSMIELQASLAKNPPYTLPKSEGAK